MKAKALYTINIDGVQYKQGEIYNIQKDYVIGGKRYFHILEEEIKNEELKKEDTKNVIDTKEGDSKSTYLKTNNKKTNK